MQVVGREPSLLCFDAAHYIYERTGIAALLERLARCAAGEGGSIRIIVTADYPPPFLQEFGHLRLEGASPQIVQAVFRERGLTFDEKFVQQVYAVTRGVPRSIQHIARLVEDTQEASPSEMLPIGGLRDFYIEPLRNPHWVRDLRRLYRACSPTERRVLTALAIFDSPVSPVLIMWALPDVEDVRMVLYDLQDRGIVVSPTVWDERVGLSPALHRFCQDVASEAWVREIHHNLATRFEFEGRILEAAGHYIAAGEADRAARILLEYADYLPHDPTCGGRLRDLVEKLLSLPPTRALPVEVRESLQRMAAAWLVGEDSAG